MLSRLLEHLREGGTRRIEDLARELDTTPQLVEAMLADLEKMGYVTGVSARCSDACGECPLSGMCAAGGPSSQASEGQIWMLTQKGEAR